VQQHGRDFAHDGTSLLTSGSALPPQTFASTEDALGGSFVPPLPRCPHRTAPKP
jgi:hypothetical protein